MNDFARRDDYLVKIINRVASHASKGYQDWSNNTLHYGLDAVARDVRQKRDMPDVPPLGSLDYPRTCTRDRLIIPIVEFLLTLTSTHYQTWIFGVRNYGIASMIDDAESGRPRPEPVILPPKYGAPGINTP